ncbi:hypothetical protein PMAC_000535 [Pneumocystis sp. 'macacae']|nr:hypothetical protein PMAC_000535 [Pneumocystis sp. 'macacae']
MIQIENKEEKNKDLIDSSKILSDFYINFCNINHIKDYEKCIHLSESSKKGEEGVKEFDDWCPIHEYIQKHKKINQDKFRKGVDEKREGFVYYYLRWPLLRGQRQYLRKKLHEANSYDEWKLAASELDRFFGNDKWMEDPQFDYYDYQLINKVLRLLKMYRESDNVEALRNVLETCIKPNFGGIENPRLYSQTYFGTKYLVDGYVTEVENYYHLGVVKALLDTKLLPNIITGTSGGALIASLVCTRTDEELMALLVPELSRKITTCHEKTIVWLKRWWKTGARFDAVDCAIRCTWFTRGSTTFKEAYERTGRILNISVVPDDHHSPPKLVNYLTAPDTVIWSALIASAAVPGILNPVPLMSKSSDGRLIPYNFGNKWKDGSLRTDIPINSLHMYFDVTYSIVSQVNPHIKTWFFSPRGAVGHPVSHRKGKGWRGGFLGSAIEQYLKHDMIKWLRVLRDLELMPRPLGQDWTHVFLQKFKGNITIWPKTLLSDFFYILSDPDEIRLSRMILYGQKATFPKLQFISHRMKIENLVKYGRHQTQSYYAKENCSNNPFYIILDRNNDKSVSTE